MSKLTHLDDKGAAHMVDVTEKSETLRQAVACATILFYNDEVLEAIKSGTVAKGDVFATARIAGIMAAKKTSELIPLCHPLMISSVSIEFEIMSDSIQALATVRTTGKTGVEMEALTAATIAVLTIYDMTKAMDRTACLGAIKLLSKSGGKSGSWQSDKP